MIASTNNFGDHPHIAREHTADGEFVGSCSGRTGTRARIFKSSEDLACAAIGQLTDPDDGSLRSK